MNRTIFRYIGCILVIGAGSVSLGQGIKNSLVLSQDFQWSGIQVLMSHHDPYKAYMDNCILKKHGCEFILSQAPNYPIVGYGFLFFFGYLSFLKSKIIWVSINLILSILLPVYIFKILKKESIISKIENAEVILSIFLFWAALPFRNSIGNGQQGLYSFSLFIMSYYYQDKNKLAAAVFLCASWLKYTITIPLTILGLVTKKIRLPVFIISAGIGALEYLFFSYYTQTSVIDLIKGPLKLGPLTTSIGYIDIASIAQRFFTYTPSISLICYLLGAGMFTTLLIYAYKMENKSLALSWGCFFVGVLVFHNEYDFVFLLFPAVYIYHTYSRSIQKKQLTTLFPALLIFYIFYLQRITINVWPVISVIILAIFYYSYLITLITGQLLKPRPVEQLS